MRATINEKTYQRFDEKFNNMEEFEEHNRKNPNLGVFHMVPFRDGTVQATYNDVRKYALFPNEVERDKAFSKGESIELNGQKYTMLDIGHDGSHYMRPIIWLE